MIEHENLLEHARHLSELFRERLTALAESCEIVRQVRIVGLMIGLELSIEGDGVVQACLDRGLLVNCTHGTVIRLLPAMNLSEEQLHAGCDILAEAIKQQIG